MGQGVAMLGQRWAGIALLCVIALMSQAEPAAAQSDSESARQALGIGEAGEAGPATLEADTIAYDPQREIVRASGDVQVFYADRVLRADEIIYDAKADRIEARGNIRVVNPDGSVLIADDATFDSRIRDGLIRGAKLVLADGRSRLAAIEGRRVDGRYSTLSKAVYSPCDVCEENPDPLWRIRARKVTHDSESHDIEYEDATFEFFGIPVAYLPYFRHADPSVKRRTGFLAPEFKSSSTIGDYIATPFFWDLGGNRDLTVAPYLGFGDVFPAGELEYRAWETYGRYRLGGSAAHSDDSEEAGFRGHFDGEGEFALTNEIELGFDALFASDDTYLRRYGFSGIDRTESRVYAQRFHDSGFASIESIYFQSYREGDFAGQIPLVAPHLDFEENFDPNWLPGEVVVSGDGLYLRRTGFQGRDTSRISGTLAWQGDYVSNTGVVFNALTSVRGDLYHVEDDPSFDDDYVSRVLPLAALTTSYPVAKMTDSATHVIEPVAQMVYAPYGGNPDGIPNEDSLSIELDELSIFNVDRFSGIDRWEDGPRATVGVRYQRLPFDGGAAISAELARSFRLRENNQFSAQSGLQDVASDVVGAWNVALFENDLIVGHRFRVSDDLDLARNEAYGNVSLFDTLHLGANYAFIEADPSVSSFVDREEGTASARLELTEYWSLSAAARHDFERERMVSASGGLSYGDECFELDLTVGHRFNDVDDAPEATTFGLAVRLKTIGVE